MEGGLERARAMRRPLLIYAFVARGTVILVDHVDFTGCFPVVSELATKASRYLTMLPSDGEGFTRRADGYTFNYLIHSGLTYCVVAIDSVYQHIPKAFLRSVRDDFVRLYGADADTTASAAKNSFSSEFGSKLRERIEYYYVDSQADISGVADMESKDSEIPRTDNVKHGEKVQLLVENTGDLHDHVLIEVQDIFTKYDQLWPGKVEHTMKELHASHMSELRMEVLAVLSRSDVVKQFSDGTNQADKLNHSTAGKKLSDPRDDRTIMSSSTKISARCRRAIKSRANTSTNGVEKVALVYNEGMLSHKPPPDSSVDEVPERLLSIVGKLKEDGLWERCEILTCDEADIGSLQAVHDSKHISDVQKISSGDLISNNPDMYFNKGSTKSALLAAGGVIKAAELVAEGACKSSFALVRPPGHHVGRSGPPSGFCFLNSVSAAAAHLLKKYPDKIKKIEIVDWDIHHGDGTQDIFYNDPRVLFFSVHRSDHGFYPPSKKDVADIGVDEGTGYNINVCWPHSKLRDVDYFAVWDHVLLPLTDEFKPDIILISAGFDAADGDPLGDCEVSPHGYATLLRKLIGKAPIAMALEGGYGLTSTSDSVAACIRELLGDDSEPVRNRSFPYETTWQLISQVYETHRPHWKAFAKGIPEHVTKKSKRPPAHRIRME